MDKKSGASLLIARLQRVVETHFTNVRDEGCHTVARGLISRYKEVFLH